MKKWTMIWGIIAGATLVLGTVLFAIGMSVLDWDFFELDTLTYTEITESEADVGIESGDTIKSFVYNGNDWDITIIKGGEFSIKYYKTEDTKIADAAFNKDTGVLSFDYEENFSWWNVGFKGLKKMRMTVEVVLPENIDLTLNATNIDVSIDGMDIGHLNVKGTNGDIKLSNLKAGNISIDGTNASLGMENCTAGDIRVDSTNGNVNLTDITGGEVKCTGTNMDFVANGCEFISVAVSGTNGDTSISSSSVSERLSFSGTNTSVYFSATDRLEDFASISVSGTNSSCYINNQKYSSGYTSPAGRIIFDVQGTNSSAKIFTKTD